MTWGLNGSNGVGRKRAKKAPKRKRTVLSKPSKAQQAARARYLRRAERETGIKLSQAEIDAIEAEILALR